MNDMPTGLEDIRTWLEETLSIARHSIYVSDVGVIACNEKRCPCAGKPIAHEMAGRRHAVECFVEAIALHRSYWGVPNYPVTDMPEPTECASCKRRATRHDGQ